MNVITINTAIIKNATGDTSQTINMENNPSTVPLDGHQTIVQVTLGSPLLSGVQYTVTLMTPRGSVFVSPSFAAP